MAQEGVTYHFTWSDNKIRELIVVKVLHTSLLNITVVTFKVLPLGSYARMPAPSPPLKTILELVLWIRFQSCCRISPDVTIVVKIPSFQYIAFALSSGTEKNNFVLDPVNREGVPAQSFV
jgi:hypothetical protein